MKRLTTMAALVALVPMSLVATTSADGAPGSASARATDSATDSVRKPAAYVVKATIDQDVLTLGEDVVTVRGKVRPRAPGRKVVLQQRRQGARTWVARDRAVLPRNGTFQFTDEPTAIGTYEYRVVKRRSDGVRKGVSPIVEASVYSWQKLAQRPRGAWENIAVSSTVLISGQPYAYSLQPFVRGAASYVEYPLKGLCTELRATYAMHDSAAAGSSSRITLALDGVTAVDQTLAKGQVVASTTDLTGALVLRYDLFSTADPASYPAVVVPEVYCTK